MKSRVEMKVPVCEPSIGEKELANAADAVKSGWISGYKGRYITEFENRFAAYCGAKYAVTTTSCATAMLLALETMGIKKGDEIITTDFTMIATLAAIIRAGAEPVLVDIDPDTWCLDVDQVSMRVNKNTVAVMPVPIYGHPVDGNAIKSLAEKNGLMVIEDAAEAIGSEYSLGRKVGSLFDATCFSFYVNKTITCLPGETKILTTLHKSGRGGHRTTPIKDLKVGDQVVSYDEVTSQKVMDDVVECFHSKADSLVCVKLSNGNELKITDNHPVYVIGKGWTRTDQLKTGDELMQYMYYGLSLRIRGLSHTGKTLEEIHGAGQAAKWSAEHSQQLSESHKNPESGYHKDGYNNRGNKIGLALSKFHKSDAGKEIRVKASSRMRALFQDTNSKFNSPEYRIARVIKSREVGARPEVKAAKREVMLTRWQDPQYRESSTAMAKIKWQDPKYRRTVTDKINAARNTPEYLAAYIKGMNMKPNKAELKLAGIIAEVSPDYRYNGNFALGISISRFIPDFVNVNGKKKVIEMFGSHWHTPDEIEIRKSRMAELGWECLIVWDSELKDKATLKDKIKTFNYNPNIEIVKVVSATTITGETDVYNIRTKRNNNYFAYGILVHNCGEGGMIVTNNESFADKARRFKGYDTDPESRFIHQGLGFNYRMTNMQAAVGCAQMDNIEHFVAMKRAIAGKYFNRLGKRPELKMPSEEDGCKNTFWVFGMLVLDHAKVSRDMLVDKLAKMGVETRRFFVPMHRQPALLRLGLFKGADKMYPVADRVSRQGLYLPNGVNLTVKQIDYVCDCIEEVLDG